MLIDGSELRMVREVYRLSREEIGALIGVSDRFISYVERGARKLPNKRGEVLVKELALTPDKMVRIVEIYSEAAKTYSKTT